MIDRHNNNYERENEGGGRLLIYAAVFMSLDGKKGEGIFQSLGGKGKGDVKN